MSAARGSRAWGGGIGWGWLGAVLGLAPTWAFLAGVPEFATQDGPTHVYNARIAARALGWSAPCDAIPHPSSEMFTVSWRLIPNWGSTGLAWAALWVVEPIQVDRLVTAMLAWGMAWAILWTWSRGGRSSDRVEPPPLRVGLAAALLGLNAPWLWGFSGFLVGALLGLIGVTVWWRAVQRPQGPAARDLIALAGLTGLGYLCHPIGLGLMVATIVAVAMVEAILAGPNHPLRQHPGRILTRTALGLGPLVPLALIYRAQIGEAGPLNPTWDHLADWTSPRAWMNQFTWVDPLALGSKTHWPWWDAPPMAHQGPALTPLGRLIRGLSAPSLLAWAAILLGTLASWRRNPDRAVWRGVGLAIVAFSLVCPDTLGESHGHYLPQRVALWGLMLLVVGWSGDAKPPDSITGSRGSPRLHTATLGLTTLAWLGQTAWVADHARHCQYELSGLTQLASRIPTGARLGALITASGSVHRSNPLLHADILLGLRRGAVVWSNYETNHYYFPIRFRQGIPRPPARIFEDLARLDAPEQSNHRRARWLDLVERHADQFDALLIRSTDPDLVQATLKRVPHLHAVARASPSWWLATRALQTPSPTPAETSP